MKKILCVLPFLFTLACDSPEAQECVQADAKLPIYSEQADDLSLRADPWASYITTWNGQPIGTKAFLEAVEICAGVEEPTWYLTVSAYDPMLSTADSRVAGLGGSAIVGTKWVDCMASVWEQNGGIEF